jgi:hypothetical protein
VHAKPLEFSVDALVAPPGVFPGQADDQLLDLLVQRRPADLAVRVGPRAGDQPRVPVQQRVGLHEEPRPAGPRQHAADRGEQRPISRLQPGTGGLAAEHGKLVAQDQDLHVLGGIAANEQHEHLNRPTKREVGEFRQYQVTFAVGSGSVTVPSRASAPTGSSRPPHTSLRTQQGCSMSTRGSPEMTEYLAPTGEQPVPSLRMELELPRIPAADRAGGGSAGRVKFRLRAFSVLLPVTVRPAR